MKKEIVTPSYFFSQSVVTTNKQLQTVETIESFTLRVCPISIADVIPKQYQNSNSQSGGGLSWHTNYYVTLTKGYIDKFKVYKL